MNVSKGRWRRGCTIEHLLDRYPAELSRRPAAARGAGARPGGSRDAPLVLLDEPLVNTGLQAASEELRDELGE